MGANRWVHLMFAAGGLLLALLMIQVVDFTWSYFGRPVALYSNTIGVVVGVVGAFFLWRRKKTFDKASEIVMELKKVTWPTRKETQAATIVVIVTVIIASAFLGLFDLIWSWATGLLYS